MVLFAGVLCLAGLDRRRSDPQRGPARRLAAEALDTGDWLTPTLYGEPHLTKPPGMSLAIGLCSLPAGKVTPLTARLPSVVAGLIVVLLFYRTFSRAWGRGRAWSPRPFCPARGCGWIACRRRRSIWCNWRG